MSCIRSRSVTNVHQSCFSNINLSYVIQLRIGTLENTIRTFIEVMAEIMKSQISLNDAFYIAQVDYYLDPLRNIHQGHKSY